MESKSSKIEQNIGQVEYKIQKKNGVTLDLDDCCSHFILVVGLHVLVFFFKIFIVCNARFII